MICDNIDHTKLYELSVIYNFIKPDILVTDVPNKLVPTFDFTQTDYKTLNRLNFHTDETIKHANTKNNIVITDLEPKYFKQYNPILVCQLGPKYATLPIQHKQWFGKQNNTPWLMCGQCNEYLSFVILKIHKQHLTIDDGSHSFEWLFWNEKTLRNKPDTIFELK